jgi:hypothetical protein
MVETNPFAITLPNYPFYNADLIPTGDLDSLCNELWPLVMAHLPESRKKPLGVEYVFRSLIANVYTMLMVGKSQFVLPKNKRFLPPRSHYRPPQATYCSVMTALKAMVEAGLIQEYIGSGQFKVTCDVHDEYKCVREATRVGPSTHMVERLAPLRAAPIHNLIQWREDAEVIHLRDKRQDKGKASSSTQVPYNDTPMIDGFRAEVQRINKHLKEHPCHYAGGLRINRMQNHVVRIFNNGDWSQGGRLYGYWPMNLPKDERHYLSIDGEPLADLDFGSCFVALLHVHDGSEFNPDAPDPFFIEGYEQQRDMIKQSAYAILNSDHRMKNFPGNVAQDNGSRPPISWKEMEALIFAHVPLFEQYAYTASGLRLMRKESDILIVVLLDLIEQGVGFIPMHDGIMVPESQKELTRDLMLKHYRAITGQGIKIKEKTINVPSQNPSYHLVEPICA